MSLFDIFTKTDQAPAPAPAQQPTVTPTSPGNLPTSEPADPTKQAEPAKPAEPATPASPLDQFKELWDTAPTDPNNPDTPPATLDPAKLEELVAKADFSKQVSPEVLAKIANGGEEAQAAFSQAMNQVAQQVMVQSTLATDKLVDQRIQAAIEKVTAGIPDTVRKQNLRSNLQDSNPIFKHPAAKPVMEATQQQLAKKYPDATAAELTEMTQSFVAALGEAFSPTSAKSANSTSEDSQDWGKYFDVG